MRRNVVIVIDESASVSARRKRQTLDLLQQISTAHWGLEDSVAILSIGFFGAAHTCVTRCSGTLSAELKRIRVTGQTPLFDALIVATESLAMQRDPLDRSVLIVFSDGEDNYSLSSAPGVIKATQELDVTIYTVDVGERYSRGPPSLPACHAKPAASTHLSRRMSLRRFKRCSKTSVQPTFLRTSLLFGVLGLTVCRCFRRGASASRFSRQGYIYDSGSKGSE